MIQNITIKNLLFVILFFCGFASLTAQEAVPFTPRLSGGNIEVRGDILFVGNNILNRASQANPEEANTPYNGTQNNNSLWMEYIDIDGDPSTFSSSSAELSVPDVDCSLVRYAGLYWASTYPNERSTNGSAPFDGTPRLEDWNEIKFRLPGGSYVDLVADNNPDPLGEEDDIIFDGYDPVNINNSFKDSPIICYKNVTSLVQAQANPNGEYTVANIRATKGRRQGSSSAGWVLVIIYENPNETGKFISTFDGYAGVQGSVPAVDVNVNGFRTLPPGFPVRARIGVAALEGDRRITNDRFRIRANSVGGFTDLTTGLNPANNFFNSTITTNGAEVPTRTPYGTNTLGLDLDVFDLDNPFNSVIPNDETGATLQFTSSGDGYGSFLATFMVEIIEPDIALEKRVEDIAGNDITGLGVNLGQTIEYVLSFQNLGNDDATGYTLRDVLPLNVTLDEGSLNLPAGVTYSFDPGLREVVFSIPDNLVEENDPAYEIRMRVRVAENCFDFVNACSDEIQNQAYSTYRGSLNSAEITDDPSVSDFDNCGFATPGATNFLLDDLANCDFNRTVELCGNNVLLIAGTGFDDYIWYADNNGDGLIDAGDTLLNDGDPDGDPGTLRVTDVGDYIVDKIVADPCKGFQEIISVVLPGVTQSNPIADLINDPTNTVEGEIAICPNDGEPLPKVFLCGVNDSELIEINIPDATSIVWERLDEASCMDAGDDCANKNSACTWNTVDTGFDFMASDSGKYRVVVNYQNGCFTRFYFDVFQNLLDPRHTVTDIVCASPGNITVTNVPANYEFQLLDATNGNILVPYSAGNGPSFDIASNGAYTVEFRQLGVVGGCIFRIEDIGVRQRDFQVDVTAQNIDCNGLGGINISVLDVNPQYYYEIAQGGTIVDTFGPSNDNNFTFFNISGGVYDVNVTTDDGCTYTEQVEVLDTSDLELTARVSQNITCKEGNILMESDGGKPPHTYAIYEFVDEAGNTQISYPTPQDIPASEFQTSVIFDIWDPGTYTFVVVDRNNCFDLSNSVVIYFEPPVEFAPTTVVDEQCFGDSTGTIQFNVIDRNGYQVTYFLIDENGVEIDTNTSGVFTSLPQGDYTIRLNFRKGSASCEYFEYYTISGPANALTFDANILQDYSCLQDGIIAAQNILGGTAPYEYSIDGVNFSSGAGAETFTGLTPGTYTLTVRDANGCATVAPPVTIDPLTPPNDLVFTATNPTCPALVSDVTASVSGGEAPFSFEIIAPGGQLASSTAGNSATFDALAPGTYTFQVTDASGCEYQENYTISPVTPIQVSGTLVSNVSCFGGADGEARFTVGGFNTSYDYNITGPATFSGTGETSAAIDLTGLAAGSYDITVTDADTNCTGTASVIIEAPAAALTLTVSASQPSCTTDGSITLTASDGWGGYTFTLTLPDASTQTNTTGVFTGLTLDGTYNAEVTDANGCVAPATTDLIPALPPVLDLTANDLCYDDATGLTLTANVTSGGDGNYLFRLNGGGYGASNVFSGLGPGTYTIDVSDGNNCTDSAVITIDPELTLAATADPITACATETNVVISAGGGDGNFVFAVVADGVSPVAGDFGSSNIIAVNGAGDYDVYVRDNNGIAGFCQAMVDLVVTQDPPLVVTPTATDILCFGDTTGTISILASGGNAPYLYSIDDGASYQSGSDFVNLPAGTYNIRVQDAEGCEVNDMVTIVEPAALVAEAAVTQQYSCLQPGEITVGSIAPTSGGSGSYQYRLSGGAWSAPTSGNFVFPDLTEGTYIVEVRDANAVGCLLSLPALIIDPLPTEPILNTSVSYNCDGTGDITVSPADPSFTYSLDGGAFQASNSFTGVAPGNHAITVNYGSDCTVDTAVVVEIGQAFSAALLSQNNLLCNGDNSGQIVFEVENFDPVNGFEYQVNGGGFSAPQTSSPITLSGLAAASYTIEVRDVLDPSCTITLNVTLNEPAPLDASAVVTQEATCTNAGAIITANATGGTPAYQYQLEDSTGAIIAPYQISQVFNAVAAGDYIIRIRDANGCEDPVNNTITITPPENITFTAEPTICYSGNNDASILVTATSGNGGYQFNINGGPWISPTPTTATVYTFESLSAGTYDINMRDGYGCVGVPQTITINPELQASALLIADLTCIAPASIDISATGGSGTYSYLWSDDGGATFAATGFTGSTFTTSTAGTYVFQVTDTSAPTACTTLTNPVVVTPAETPLITSVSPSDILCFGDLTGSLDIVIDTSVGLPPYTINVFETNTSTDYGTQTSGLPAGNYEVTITDSKGCVSLPFPAIIAQPDALSYNIDLQPITCSSSTGTVPGSITVENLSGGTPEYTYYLTGNNGYSAQYNTTSGGENHTFSILEFGIYEVDVVDVNGCSVQTTNIIASPPDDLDIDVSTLTADCTVGGTAIVTVSSAVGSGNYEFAILETYSTPYSGTYLPADTAGGDTATFTGLIPGITYTFVVHDLTTNCYYFETADTPINSPSNMSVSSMLPRNITCTGAADGSITFDIANFDAGSTEVQYEVYNFQSNDPLTPAISGSVSVNPPAGSVTISDLGPLDRGVYYVLLTEVGGAFNGCSIATPEFTISESTNLLAVSADSPQNDNCAPNAGIIVATAQFGTPPYEFQYLPDTDPAPTASSAGWTIATTANVEAGNYIVYVKDANGCIQSDAVTVILDPSPVVSLAIVDECVSEGSFEVLMTLTNSGVAPYQLSVNGSAYQNVAFNGSNQYTVSGLSSGPGQTFSVRDVNGCVDTQTIDIEPPLQFTAFLSTLLDCESAPANNAEITIEVTSGSGNYEYEISGPVSQARTNLPSIPFIWDLAGTPGTYTITVYDAGTSAPNCLGSIDVEVPPAVLPEFTETHQDVSCFGASDGSITLYTTDNGVAPLTFSISPAIGSFNAATNTFENLPAGTYEITGVGTNNCLFVIPDIIIGEPLAISVPAPAVTPFGCIVGNNPENASISADIAAVTGGSGVYPIIEFVNDQGTPSTADDVVVQSGNNWVYTESDPAGGSYLIYVYDTNGCVGATTAVIPPYDELQDLSAAITNLLTCVPGSDGEITLSATSTLGDPTRFEYSIDNGATYQASNVFNGLGAGTYFFLARHIDTGCLLSTTETLADPNTFDVVADVVADVVCFGTQTGQVTLELVDATYSGPFDWVIYDINGTPSDTSDDVVADSGSSPTNGPTPPISLFAGEYRAEVSQTNAPECSNSVRFNIAGPDSDITGSVLVTDITCLGNDGIIEIYNVQGGWGGYSYYVGTGAPSGPGDYNMASARFENLAAGTYQAWVVDLGGCERLIQDNIILSDPAPITAALQVNQENCTSFQGEIEVVGTAGGQGSNYTYQLILDGSDFGPPQTSPVFSGLGAGTYEVRISDQWSCTTVVGPETLYVPITLTGTVVKPIDCTTSPDGEITINVTGGSSNLEFTVIYPDGITTDTNNTGVFTGLGQAGTYNFTVTDLDTAPICVSTLDMTLENPTPVTLDPATIVNVSCNGGSDGSIRVNLEPTGPGVNDNPPYVFSLYDGSGSIMAGPQPGELFTGLTAGTYTVEAISALGCSVTQPVTITEPSSLTLAASATPFACAPDNTVNISTITATVPAGAGTAPYLYSIDGVNYQAGNTFEVADTGSIQNITVVVRDANGCSTSAPVTIDPLNTFDAVVSQNIAISCINPEEVLITVTDNGNPGNTYTFELLPVGNPNGVQTATPTNTSAVFELNAPGNYVFRVTDAATGCFLDTAPYDITPFDLVAVTATPVSPVICFGDSNGEVSLDISGFSGNYSYEVFTAAGVSAGISGNSSTTSNPFTVTGLSGGNYFIRITETDAPFCQEDSNVFTITSPDIPLSTSVTEVANVTCTNDQGEILVAPEGGYAPYEIVLSNTTTGQDYTANSVTSNVFTGLSAGSYAIRVTDAQGCEDTGAITLAEPLPITADIMATPTTLVCYGDENAIVSAINVAGGEGSYSYQLNVYDASGSNVVFTSGTQPSPDFVNLGSGIYSITITDGWACTFETPQVVISEPTEVMSTLVQAVQMTCTTNAELVLTASGGNAPYQYSTDGITYFPMSGGNSHTFSVTDGVYQYYVSDSNGCEASLSNQVSVEPIPPLLLDIDQSAAIINCAGESTAMLTAVATGGLGNYQYELFGDNTLTTLIAGPQNTGSFSGLPQGSYWIRATSLDCEAVSDEILITDPAPLQIDREESTNVTCAGEANGTISVEVSGGTGEILYAISPNLNQFDTTNEFFDLEPGVYDVIAQDENGCFIAFEFTIAAPLPVEVSATTLPEVCSGSEDGSVELTITGGTAPYSTAFNSNDPADYVPGQTSFSGLATGTYVIFVLDAAGCETNTIVEIGEGVNLNATVTPVYECTGAIPENRLEVLLEDPSVSGEVMYALDSTDPADMQLDPDFVNLAPGPHYLAISHINGCVLTIDFEIEGYEPLELALEQRNLNEITAIATGGVPEYTFYFNGVDNGNDNTFYITETGTYTVMVIDESGCMAEAQIFMEFIDIVIPNFFTPDGDGMNDLWIPENIEGFPQILIKIYDRYGRVVDEISYNYPGWDGNYNGKELPTGDYWYTMQLNGDNDPREFVGHFTLYR